MMSGTQQRLCGILIPTMASTTFQRLHKLRCLLIDVQGALPSEPVDLHQRIAQGLLDLDSLCSAEVSLHQLAPSGEAPQPDRSTTTTTPLSNNIDVAKSTSGADVSGSDPDPGSADAIAKQCATALEAKEHATAAFKAHNYEAALALCSRAVELEPEDAAHYSNRSLAHLRLGSFNKAQTDAAAAVALKPAWGRAHYRLGAARRARDDLTGALASLTKAVELDPKDATSSRALHETQAALREANNIASAAEAENNKQGSMLSTKQRDENQDNRPAAVAQSSSEASDVEAEVVAAVAAAQREAAKEKAQRAEAEAERLREETARRHAADLAHQKKAEEAAMHAVSARTTSAAKVELQDGEKSAARTVASASATVEPLAKTPPAKTTPLAQPNERGPAAVDPKIATDSTKSPKFSAKTSNVTSAASPASAPAASVGKVSPVVTALEPCADGSFDLGDADDVVLPGQAVAIPSKAPSASIKQHSSKQDPTLQRKKPPPPQPPQAQSEPTPPAPPLQHTPMSPPPPPPPATAAAAVASSAEVKKEWQGALPPLGQLLTPLGIVPAIQECLVRAASGGGAGDSAGGGGSSGLSDEYVAARFRGLDQEMLEVPTYTWGVVVVGTLGLFVVFFLVAPPNRESKR
jgi:tetratricopeptide (TPR) repeat protein